MSEQESNLSYATTPFDSKEMLKLGRLIEKTNTLLNDCRALLKFEEGEKVNPKALLDKLEFLDDLLSKGADMEEAFELVFEERLLEGLQPVPDSLGLFFEEVNELVSEERLLEEKSAPVSPDQSSFKISVEGQYYAGLFTGTFLVNPTIRYFKDQLNGENENKFLIEYYSEMFSSTMLAHLTTAAIVPLTTKLISSYLGIPE